MISSPCCGALRPCSRKPRVSARLHAPARKRCAWARSPNWTSPPAALARLDLAGARPRLGVRFFGLTGPQGPMPLHFTEYVRERARNHGDPTLARFLDLFHHRLLSLFYRAWALRKAQSAGLQGGRRRHRLLQAARQPLCGAGALDGADRAEPRQRLAPHHQALRAGRVGAGQGHHRRAGPAAARGHVDQRHRRQHRPRGRARLGLRLADVRRHAVRSGYMLLGMLKTKQPAQCAVRHLAPVREDQAR
jgi:predicted component of type VI protein secretion system